jgi:hypothetical protein
VPESATDKKTRGGGKTFATYQGKTFIQINDALKNDPNSLPASLTDEFTSQCASEGYRGLPTTTTKSGSGGGPTTTSAP